MTCDELEALRLGLLNVLGEDDQSVRAHAEAELGEDRSGPVDGLATAETMAAIERHLDAAIVDLETEVAETPDDDPDADYLRGRLLAVREAERAVRRLRAQQEAVLDGLGETHEELHETFPEA